MRSILRDLRPHFLEVKFFIPTCLNLQIYLELLLVLEILCDFISGFLVSCMFVFLFSFFSFEDILALIGYRICGCIEVF